MSALLEAAASGRLVVFAGAGISVEAPSCLPDWSGFNRLLLDALKTSALELPGISQAAAGALRRFDLNDLAVEAFSDAIVSSFAGEGYFPVLDVLDAEQPNAHHLALAALARRGACRALVTTNFDTLLERACAVAGVAVEVFATPDDFRKDPAAAVGLYKIHGSVTSTASLIDTVSQKLRGLSFPVRARLTSLFRGHHVLVVGFSGADLSFGADYLALSSLARGDGGLTWVVQPGRTLHPQAAAIVGAVGGEVIQASLDDVFASLDVRVSPAMPLDQDRLAPARAEAERRARTRVRLWFEGLGNGALSSAVFFVDLANGLGRHADAQALLAALAAEVDRSAARGSLPLTALLAFNTLAIAANDSGDYRAGEQWSNRAAALYQAVMDKALTISEPISPAGRRDLDRQWITICLAMSRARAGLGDATGARDASARAERAALKLGDAAALSQVATNDALLLASEHAALELQLEKARQVWSLASKGGSALYMTQGAAAEAELLMRMGEYDAALSATARAARVARWAGFPLVRLTTAVVPAVIAARRGLDEDAMTLFESGVAGALEDPVAEARLTIAFAATSSFRSALRAQTISLLDRVIAAMDQGQLVADGSNPHLPSREQVTAWRTDLQDARFSETPPGFLDLQDGVPGTELELRRALLAAELNGDAHTAAKVLVSLANGRFDPAKPRRLADLANAALIAAERAGDNQTRLAALFLTGVGSDLSGDLEGAMKAQQQLLNAVPAAPETLRMSASQNLALVLARVGRTAEAEPLLRATADYHAKRGEVAEQARSIIALADALARGGSAERARAVLEENMSVVDATGDPLAVGKRDAMLVSLRRARTTKNRGAGLPVLFAEAEGPATPAHIEHLRSLCESAADRCDVAALALWSNLVGSAVALVLEAQAQFHAESNLDGVARCFHLLADAAQIEGRWDAAADHTRFALMLHTDMQDMGAQNRTVATLSFQFAVVERADLAMQGASQFLEHDQPGPISRFTVVGLYALAEAHRLSGHWWRARRAAKHARAALNAALDLPSGSPLRVWLGERLHTRASFNASDQVS